MSYTMRTRAPSKLSIVHYATDNLDHDTHEEDSRDEESIQDSELSDVESISSDAPREEKERLHASVGAIVRNPTIKYLGDYATRQAQVSMNSHDEESIDDYPELSDGESIDSDTIKKEQERLHSPLGALVRSPTVRFLGDYANQQAPYSMSPPSRPPPPPPPPPSRPRRSTIDSIGTVGSGMTNFDPSDVPYRHGFPGMRYILAGESETGEYAPYHASDWDKIFRPTAEEWRDYGISMLAEFRATGKLRNPKPPEPSEPVTPPPSPVVSTSRALVKLMASGGADAEEIQKLIEKTKKVENVERKKVNTPKWERKWKVKEAKLRARALRIAAAKASGSSNTMSLVKFVEPRELGFILDPALKTQLELAKASKCRDYAALKAYEEKRYGWPDPIIKIRKVVEVVEEPEELMTEDEESDDEEPYHIAVPAPSPEAKVNRDFLGIRKGFKKAGHAVKEFFSRATSALHRPWARKGDRGKSKEKVVGAKHQAFKRLFSSAALAPTNGGVAKKGKSLKGLFSPTNDDGAKMGDAFKRIFSPATFSATKFEVREDVDLKGKEEDVKVASKAVDVYFSAATPRAPSGFSPYGTDTIDSREGSTTSFSGSFLARLRGRTDIRNFSRGKIPSGSYIYTPDLDVRNFSSASIVYIPNPSFISTPVNADTSKSSDTVHRIPPAQTTSVGDTVKTANLGSTTPINNTASAATTASDADMEAIARLAARKLAKLARLRAAKKRNQAEKKAQEERRKADEEKRKAEEQIQAKKRAEQERRKVKEERRKAGEGTHQAEEERLKKLAAKERLNAEDEKRKADEEKQAKIARFEARRKVELEHQRRAETERRKANEEKLAKAVAELVERRKAEPDYLRTAQLENKRRTEAEPDLFEFLKTATRKANEQKRKVEGEQQAKVAADLEEKRRVEEERLAELVAKAKLKAAEQRRTAELEKQRRIEADRVANDLLKTNKVDEIAPWETQASVAARMLSSPHDIDEQDWEDVEDDEEEKADTVATPQKEDHQAKSTSSSIGNPTSNDPSTQTGERTPRQSDFNQTTGTNITQTSKRISSAMSNDSNTLQDLENSTINAPTMPSSSTGQPANTKTHTNPDGFVVRADGRRPTAAEILKVNGEPMARSRAGADEVDKYLEARRNGTLRVGTFAEFVDRPLPTNGSADETIPTNANVSADGTTPTSVNADGTTPTSVNVDGNNTPAQTSADGTHTTGAHPLPPLPGMPSTPVPSNPMSARHLDFLEEIRKRQEERDTEWARLQKEIDEMHEMAAKALESSPAARMRREEQCKAARAIDDAVEELRVWMEERKAAKASAAAGAGGKGKEVKALESPRAECSRAGRVRREEQRRAEIDEMIKKAREGWEARKASASTSAAAAGRGKGKEVEAEKEASRASTSADAAPTSN